MIVIKIRTVLALGIINLGRFLLYKVGVRLGLNPVKKISATIDTGLFFKEVDTSLALNLPANNQWVDQQSYFGWKNIETANIPDWHKSVLTGESVKKPLRPWWDIVDFDPELGDIKGVWEASRFDWVLCFAQNAAAGNKEALVRLNDWLTDWSLNNPPYLGVNWKCGQEASIRVMHLAIASLILQQHSIASSILMSLVKAHLQRIEPTISYAIAQDNNHGTSEAAALFIGGSWLILTGDKSGDKYYRKGRKWLENRAERLIEQDGGFSQYSTTYHRVMLDTYSMVEVWRKKLELKPFSQHLYNKLSAATNWLYQLIQFENGDTPNLGANDGARLLPLTANDYRDFRPSVQLASILFNNKRALEQEGDWNLPLRWLNLEIPNELISCQSSSHFSNSGYFVLRNIDAFVMLSYPKYRFRPSQADALHLDFWSKGENLLCDAGTYSYNAGEKYIEYFGGTKAHNTIEFDDRDQMPRLSRFLLGSWLTCKRAIFSDVKLTCTASYKDFKSACHERSVTLLNSELKVVDKIKGFNKKAVLRWRLKGEGWNISGDNITNGEHTLSVSSNVPTKRFEIVEGWKSLYYFQRRTISVLEIEICQEGILTSIYKYK